MFRLPAFPRFVILFWVIAFDAQYTGAPKQTRSNNAGTKQTHAKNGYVSTQTIWLQNGRQLSAMEIDGGCAFVVRCACRLLALANPLTRFSVRRLAT
jgi:hypothetical protein